MGKIKLNESQVSMLQKLTNNKSLKITNEQYKRLFESSNEDTFDGISQPKGIEPSTRISKNFKKYSKGNPSDKFKFENDEAGLNITGEEFGRGIIKYLKELMISGSESTECDLCNKYGVNTDDILKKMTSLGIITSGIIGGNKNIQIRRTNLENNISGLFDTFKELSTSDEEVLGVGMEENEKSDDDIKRAMSEPFEKKHKQDVPIELLKKKIAKIRAKELNRRELQNEPNINENNPAQGNLDLEIWSNEYAILEGGGEYFVFCVSCVDKKDLLRYRDELKKYHGKDEDGMPDVEYEDGDLIGLAIQKYINDNKSGLDFGTGLKDWEEGSDIVSLDQEMLEELKSDVKYIKNPKIKQEWGKYLDNGFGIEETTTASSSGAFVAPMNGGSNKPIHRGMSPQSSMGRISKNNKINESEEIKETIGGELKYNNIMHPKLGNFSINDIYSEREDDNKKSYIITLTDGEGGDSSSTLLYIYDKENGKDELYFNHDFEKLYDVYEIFDDVYDLVFDKIKEKLRPSENEIEEQGIGNSGQYATPGFASSEFMGTKGKKGKATVNKGITHDKTMYNKGRFVDETKQPKQKKIKNSNNKPKKLKKSDGVDENENQTAYPSGEFVELDDCTKLNNNKEAQNGGCSVGAVDNVVKTKKTKNSVISKDALYYEIAKKTGKTVSEVKDIVKKKDVS